MAKETRATQAVAGRKAGEAATKSGGKGRQDQPQSTNPTAGKFPTVVHVGTTERLDEMTRIPPRQ